MILSDTEAKFACKVQFPHFLFFGSSENTAVTSPLVATIAISYVYVNIAAPWKGRKWNIWQWEAVSLELKTTWFGDTLFLSHM